MNNLCVPARCVASVNNLHHPSLSKWKNPTLGLFSCLPLELFLAVKDISKDFCLGSVADPEDNKEDGSQGAADAGGGRAEASKDGAGAAVHPGEAGG